MNLEEYRAKRAQQRERYKAARDDLELTFDISDRILDLRLERGWTQDELADKIKATAYYVDNLESGLVSPTVRMMELLAKVFCVKLTVELG